MNYQETDLFLDVYEIAEKLADAITKYGKKQVLLIVERILLNDKIKIVFILLETIKEYFKIPDKKLILEPKRNRNILPTARKIFIIMMYHRFKLSQKEIALIIKRKVSTVSEVINSLKPEDRKNPYLCKTFFNHYDEILKLTLKKIENGTNKQQTKRF